MQSFGLKAVKPPAAPQRSVKHVVAPHTPLVPGFIARAAPKKLQQATPGFPSYTNEAPHPFVRPDCPPEEAGAVPPPLPSRLPAREQGLNNIVERVSMGDNEKIHFRSALEQVSYQTNKEMMGSVEDDRPHKMLGALFGRRK